MTFSPTASPGEPLANGPTYVGRSVPRGDAADKVSGRARYVDDIVMPGMIFGATVRSNVARGTIRGVHFGDSVDWSKITVVQSSDVPKNEVALIEYDQPLLAAKDIRHCYEPIVLLACEDRALLARAVRAVRIDVDELPPLLNLDDAIRADIAIRGADNIQKTFTIAKGDVARGRAGAATMVSGTYFVPHQEHVYIEPQGMIAWWDAQGVHVLGSIQCPYYVHKAIVHAFGLATHEVDITQAVTGGGFGGKEEYPSILAAHAALLARKAQRPVKMIYGRQEDIEATTKRHPARVRITAGVREDGTLASLEIDIAMDGGAYVTLTPVVLSRGILHATGPYRCDHVQLHARAYATNTPPNGAFRGFGAPQTIWAIERHMDRIAEVLGVDPLDLRKRNLFVPGDVTATGQVLKESVGGEACVRAAESTSEYARKRAAYSGTNVEQTADGRRIRRGIGASVFFHGSGFTGSGERRLKGKVRLDLIAGGRLAIRTTSTDIGQGTETVFRQIAAQAAKLSMDSVQFDQPSTSHAPDSGPTVASRTVMVVGGIVEKAARALRERVRASIAEAAGAPVASVTDGPLVGNGAVDFVSNGRPVAFAPAADALLARQPDVFDLQEYVPPLDRQWDDDTYTGDAYPVFSWGCDIAEVEVDLDTYETRITGFWAAQDVGSVIHPVMCAGQVEGGTLQAIGWALFEDIVWDRGKIKNARMTNYVIPTALDAPTFTTILVERPFVGGPFGAKGVGELPMDGGAPALAAAIEQALGVPLNDLPMLPERVFEAVLNARKGTSS